MSTPAVSVIVPTFQRRSSVLRALASLLAQSHEDLEAIVVDDGSTDGTAAAVQGIDDRRVRLVEQANAGAAAARNAGLAVARAPVIAFLDSDDRWRADHLEVVLALLEQHPGAVLSCTDAGGLGVDALSRPAGLVDALPEVLIGGYLFTSAVAIRRFALDALGGFDERLLVTEDSDLWCRLALDGPFALSAEETVHSGIELLSLREQGRAKGLYPVAHERLARRFAVRASQTAGRRPADETRRLVDAGRGAASAACALGAIIAGDEARARTEFARAERLFPEVAANPNRMVRRLGRAHPEWHDPAARAEAVELLARVWPGDVTPLRVVA